ncbi:spliceosome associated protein [Anopheles darlingi]|uniref:Splicing factor 3A subunit 1 n=1 Tax=Anopheles darlingi TaxID=43151 RepID=W5JSY5_ANODA|nr:spliceosome associated protein [Anopheles darlingi]
MTEVESNNGVETAMPEAPPPPTLSGPIVGIIYPPPEVRNIVDKTASFVARNGPEFESRIRQNELGNPKFNFLGPGDPYHAYYQHKVQEIREGRTDTRATNAAAAGLQKLQVSSATQQKQQELLKAATEQQFVPKDPPPEFEFIADPPSISALDLDIVKLTAQFVARNGRLFLTNLMNREQRNCQFDFLRPQHSLFQYFTKLLEQYTKILVPPKDLMNKLKVESAPGRSSMNVVLEQVKYRANWMKHQELQSRREEEKVERERIAYAQIDWHDFVVVEVVDYQPYESGNFPPPTTPDEVGARVLMEERLNEEDHDIEMQIESDNDDSDEEAVGGPEGNGQVKLSQMENLVGKQQKDNTQVQDMDESSTSGDEAGEGERQKSTLAAPIAPPTHDKVIVKKYDPKQAQKVTKPVVAPTDDYLISPITGEKIPAAKVAEHMRIGLLDPRWVEQRDKHIEKVAQENVYAPGAAIEASLKQLAERRTDIFGVGDEEAAIGKKLGEEEPRKDDRVTWDGHTSSVEAATRAARANITLEAQIHQIHKVKGLIADEEKEKIGPKPIPGSVGNQPKGGSSQHQQQQQQHHHQQQQQQQQQQHHHHQQQQHHHQQQQQQQHHHHHQSQQSAQQAQLAQMQQAQKVVLQQQQQQQQQQHAVPPPVPPMMMMAMGPPPFGVGSYVPSMAPHGAPQLQQGVAPTPLIPDTQQQQQQQQQHEQLLAADEPPSKKSRTEDNLIEESAFLQRHGASGPITVLVQCPSMTEKNDWKLNGQTLSLVVNFTDTVSSVKAKIQTETGMPPAKQKIFYDGMFFKDNNTIAYYNLMNGVTVALQLKERGGRKK